MKKPTTDPRTEQITRGLNELAFHINFIPDPSYFFSVGDTVRCGHLQDVTVEEVLEGGKAYIVHAYRSDKDEFHKPVLNEVWLVQPWYALRPVVETPFDSHFSGNQRFGLNFSNRPVESVLHAAYQFGIKMDPEYQRDFVWTDDDRTLLLDSIFAGADIGKIVLGKCKYEKWKVGMPTYEIIDGKQRLHTLMLFYENKFCYRGYYFNDLSGIDRNVFLNHLLHVAEIECESYKDTLSFFVTLNRAGVTMDREQLRKVEDMICDIT